MASLRLTTDRLPHRTQLCGAAARRSHPAVQVAKERGGEGGGAAAARASAALGLPPLLHGFEVFLAGGCLHV